MSEPQRKITVIPAKPQAIQQSIKRQMNVAAYCRVSTEEEEQQSSYEAQCSYYTDKIMKNPEWNMAGIFADEGITGTSTKKRDNFNRMIRKCRQKKIDLILTKSISRFARNTVDCLKYIRALKELGIGIYFEKENINTMEMETELIITFLGAFAQSESESISANVKWGIRQSMKSGKTKVNFKRLYGYYVNDDGAPCIDQEKAYVVKFIFSKYLAGDSLRNIRDRLHQKEIPAPNGSTEWKISAIRSILNNEKYCGDVLMQKTFVEDCINKKVVKNTGQFPMYLVENNHPGIISREIYRAAQTEQARRTAAESPSKKNAPTGRTSYTSKYALSERLVCGECGTLYRRCVWSRNGQKRAVWRCVSRLDYGTKYCHDSPTMDEDKLQQAIMEVVNSQMSPKLTLVQQITDTMIEKIMTAPNFQMTLGDVERRIQELNEEFLAVFEENDNEKNVVKFREITEELAVLKEQREHISGQLRNNAYVQECIDKVTAELDQANHHITEWSEEMVRQLVHTVKVISADHIKVYLNDGTEIDQEVHT